MGMKRRKSAIKFVNKGSNFHIVYLGGKRVGHIDLYKEFAPAWILYSVASSSRVVLEGADTIEKAKINATNKLTP